MLLTMLGHCDPGCGVRVKGEFDPVSREFIHSFSLAGSEQFVKARQTEVDGIRLATFPPDTRDWRLDCPVCGRPIVIRSTSA